MNNAQIIVSAALRESACFSALAPNAVTFGNLSCDASVPGKSVLLVHLSTLVSSHRGYRSERSDLEARMSSTGATAVIVYCDVEEPEVDSITYVNEACFGRQLLIAWTPDEVAQYLYGLRDAGVSALHAGLARPKQNESLHTLLDVLQTSKVMNRTDATRLADKFETPAQVLGAALHDLESLPQFGNLKARKMHKLLHTEFPTTRRRLTEMTQAAPAEISQRSNAPAPPTLMSSTSSAVAAQGDAATTQQKRQPQFRSAAEAGRAALMPQSGRRSTIPAAPASVAAALARLRDDEETLSPASDPQRQHAEDAMSRLIAQLHGRDSDDE